MRKSMILLIALSLLVPLVFLGCSGDDGAQGPQGATGATGDTGEAGQDASAVLAPESCVVCHGEIGDEHQAIYDAYADASTLNVSIVSATSVDNGTLGFFDVTMVFDVTQNGAAYIDEGKDSDGNGFPTLDQETFYTVAYDNVNRRFIDSKAFDRKSITHLGAGRYSAIAKGVAFGPELPNTNALVYSYVVKGKLAVEGMQLYSDVSNAARAYGDVGSYESAANVAGCEKCHGTPYLKHGYRAAQVAGLPDFAACKVCHYDTRNGGHQSWQLLVDNPARYAELHELAKVAAATGDTAHNSVEKNMTTDEKTIQYKYTANVMNDVHMSHAMEFPYPQSMANCVTCHDNKLDMILTDAFFVAGTCKSCHPVTGGKDRVKVVTNTNGTTSNVYEYDTTKFALTEIWKRKGVDSFHNVGQTCNTAGCHATGGNGKTFGELHTGYNKLIYTSTGQKYSAAFTVTIDNASFANNVLTFGFHTAENTDVAGLGVDNVLPTVLVGLYGWDTKDYIVGPHESHSDGKRNLETALNASHPRITGVSAGSGAWTVTADLSTWADKISNGTVKRVEIAVLPQLKDAAGNTLALNAPSKTFDLGANAFVSNYFQGTGAIVNVADGCNKCHEALATTFHSGNRGGNIVVCRLCHTTKSGGSHLEMQSRSIDSYVHAIHSFQAFDIGDVDFTDPVEATMYDLHVEHVYPNFTIKNCKSCHVAGKFNVPDQSKSLPGVLSAADPSPEGWNRNIGAVESYVTGPATRACGGCHRAAPIKEDNPVELSAFNSHTRTMGYMVEYVDAAGTETVINSIMANFYDGIVLSAP